MAVRSRLALAFAAAAALSLAACERADDAPASDPATADAAPPADVPTPAEADADIDATRVVDRAPVAGAAPGFDVKAFAGTFVADGAHLQLAADGTYAFTVRAESADADLVSTGTWTVEDDGAALLLDPDSKGESDQRFTLVSSDELAADVGGRVLRRDGA